MSPRTCKPRNCRLLRRPRGFFVCRACRRAGTAGVRPAKRPGAGSPSGGPPARPCWAARAACQAGRLEPVKKLITRSDSTTAGQPPAKLPSLMTSVTDHFRDMGDTFA
jgi:hypothetical protein